MEWVKIKFGRKHVFQFIDLRIIIKDVKYMFKYGLWKIIVFLSIIIFIYYFNN